mgnify:CR=1 FL=1
MAYKFQFGQAILSGALDQEGDIQVKDQSGNTKILLDDNGIISGAGNFQTDGALVMRDVTRITAAGAGSFVGVAAGGAITTATSIDGSGDLTMGTITMSGFTVDADGDTALKSLAIDNSSTIGCDADTDIMTLAAQSLALADDVDFNVAKAGGLQIAGSAVTSTAAELNFLDGSTAGTAVASKAVVLDASRDIANLRNITGAGNLNMNTISMTGFSVQDDGDTALKSLAVDNSSTIGCDADTDIMTFAAQSLTIANDVDFNVNKAGGLQIAGSAVTSTAAELNFLDGSTAGTAVASKAVVLDASKDITGLGQLSAVGLSGSLRFSLDVEADGGLGMTPFQNSANVADLKISGAFMPATAAVLASESFVGLSASGSVKQFSIADLATAQAGDGLAASSGVLSVGVDDSSIEINSDALRVKAAGITDSMLNDDVATGLAGVGLAAASGVMALDLNELGAADIDVANDSIAIIDANDSNASKKESIVDLVAGIAGAGLSAASGQLSVQGNSVAAVTDGTTVSEGYNFATGSDGGTVLLPASPSVGDVVTLKNSSGGVLVLARGDAGHDIDGQSAVVLESPFAAVTCVYMVANKWKIV